MRTPALLMLLFVAAVATLLLGCGDRTAAAGGASQVLDLSHWTLEAPLGTREVVLPARFDDLLPRERSRYDLTTSVDLPPAFRGKPLTLAITFFPAKASLRANGHEALALDTTPFDRYRSGGALRWRVEPEQTRGDRLDLELDVEHGWTASGWLEVVPTLSATPLGDERFVFISSTNRVAAIGGFTTTIVVSLIYGIISLLDRRRPIHVWHAAQGLCGMLYPAFFLGALQPALGTADLPVTAIAMTGGCVASVHFVATVFDRPRPSRAWWLFVLAATAVSVVRGGPFEATSGLAPVTMTALLAVSAYALLALWRRWQRGRPSLVEIVAGIGIPTVVVCSVPDAAAILGLPAPLGGLQGGCLAVGAVSLLHAFALSRTHSQSLHNADDLNAQLTARVTLLEASNKEIGMLNEELRRQIAARSERLAETLARLGPMHTPPRAFAPGDAIDGRYRVVRRIGEGGMGTVYEIERLADGRRLALKVLQTPRSGAELARLAREAEIASRVDHPNVVSIVDVDIAASGALFVVMEYVAGASLDAMRARYADAPWAVGVLRQVAAGLTALHAAGIVHRDLKPGNVLVAQGALGDVAKIADFGIATRSSGDTTTAPREATPNETLAPRDLEPRSGAGKTDTLRSDAPLTLTGQILGTPVYMAPELLRGAKLATPASDVYSFGVIAWEILTGALPEGFEVLMHLRSREGVTLPSIRTLLPALSPRVAELLDACLARDAMARPEAAALALALATPHEIPAQAS